MFPEVRDNRRDIGDFNFRIVGGNGHHLWCARPIGSAGHRKCV